MILRRRDEDAVHSPSLHPPRTPHVRCEGAYYRSVCTFVTNNTSWPQRGSRQGLIVTYMTTYHCSPVQVIHLPHPIWSWWQNNNRSQFSKYVEAKTENTQLKEEVRMRKEPVVT